jgi:2,4-dienoyl-CoA reductase-like NADH-dependent reductase (Old Yellow Enzyme family)
MLSAPDPTLLTPIKVGALELPNRVVITAHGTQWSPWTDAGSARYLEYQRRRVAGGAGMLVAEGVWVESNPTPADLEPLAGPFARFTEAMRGEGTGVVTVLQLVGAGASDSSDGLPRGRALMSFNGMQSSTDGEPSRRMSADEIAGYVDGHAQLAAVAVANGMDGVELLAGYGYLLHQSLSPWGNGRTDEWGEPLAFAKAIIAAIRDRIGPNKIIGFRMPVDDDRTPHEGGNRRAELAELAAQLVAESEVDYLNPCMGSRVYEYTARTARSYRYDPGVDLPLAAGLRRTTGGAVPVVGVNRILTPEQGEAALQRGECDLVALTRAHMADPDVLVKYRAGRSERIRPCVGANDCGSVTFKNLGLMCFHNPELGREAQSVLEPAAAAHKVVVIGAGPAGLKAAEIATRRGHEVLVLDALDEPGGQLRHVRATTARSLYRAVEWLVAELVAAGVELRLNTPVDDAELRRAAPDAVVLATGAQRDALPPIPGAESTRLLTPIDVLAGAEVGPNVLVVDRAGDMEASLVAEALIARGNTVGYVTPLDSFAPRAGGMQHLDLLPIFEAAGCAIVTKTDVECVQDGRAVLVDRAGRRTERRVDTIVAALAPRPVDDLLPAVRAMGIPYHLIGDALAPRHARAAIDEGDLAGRAI